MSEKSSLLVIVNNSAARARKAWPRVREALARGRISFEAREAVMPGETEERTRTALLEGFKTVAVVGGDGTLSAAAAGYFEPCAQLTSVETPLAKVEAPRAVNASAALAILPAGTGDDFARGLAGGRRDSLEAWAARLVEHCRAGASGGMSSSEDGDVRSVDVLLGSTDGGAHRFVCLNAATLGIGAEVAGRVAAQQRLARRMPGDARFAIAAVQSLAAWRERRARVALDGEVWVECEMNLVAVTNGPTAGGGMKFSPEASVTDGMLDVVTVCGISRAGLVRELSRIHRGGHLANPKVKLARGRIVRVETLDPSDALAVEADGDVRGQTPAEFRVLPSALRVVC